MGVGAWKGRTQRPKLVCSHIKGLSHEMDLAFGDMYTVVSSQPKQGTRPVLKLFICSNDFNTKSVFSRLMQVYVDLILLSWCTQSRFPCFLLGDFFRYRSLLPIGCRIVQTLHQRGRKTTNAALSAMQAASQSVFINEQFNHYTPLLINRNDKNKQLTLLSQRKLALTARNTFFAL